MEDTPVLDEGGGSTSADDGPPLKRDRAAARLESVALEVELIPTGGPIKEGALETEKVATEVGLTAAGIGFND